MERGDISEGKNTFSLCLNTNRGACCGDRIGNFSISISLKEFNPGYGKIWFLITQP